MPGVSTPPTHASTPPGPTSLAPYAARAGGLVVGQLLRAAFGAVAVARGTKPLHPRGVLRRGTLLISPGPGAPTGVPLLDTPATHDCLVRPSRSVGLPRPLPDIEGLALRLPGPDGRGDLLFASTGTGAVTRHLLLLRRSHAHGPLTTLLPLRSPTGPLLVGLFPRPPQGGAEPDEYDLRVARPGRDWRGVGLLRIGDVADEVDDPPVRFDPVEFPVPGLEHYPGVAEIRSLAYRGARSGYPAETVAGLDRPGTGDGPVRGR